MADISRMGEFSDPGFERGFAQSTIAQARAAALLCVIATTTTSLCFAPLDLLMLEPPTLAWFLGDRLLIAVICAIWVALVVSTHDVTRLVRHAHTHQYIFFTLNALIFNHPVLLRHGGALLPLIAISLFIFLPGSFRRVALLSAYAPTVSLLFWGVLRPAPEGGMDLAVIVLLTLVAYVVGGLARSQFGRIRREEYLHQKSLRDAKEAAEAGAKAKADFLAVMSHEIRTPMNGVLGMLRLVLDSPLPDQAGLRLRTACQSAESLLVILDDILDFSKLEAGPFEVETTPFNLTESLGGVVALMELRAAEKGLTLRLQTDPDLPAWVAGDVGRLRQVLFNLVGNAVKFTEAGSVTLKAEVLERQPGQVRLGFAVIDTGPGIDDRQRNRLFEPFSQADASISRRFGGTGLGLVISKRLVEGMGGVIAVDSTPGKGSTFHFQLTFTPCPPPAATVPDTATVTLLPLRLLLAEDNPVNQIVTRDMLESAGHHVTIANDGVQALALAGHGDYDLILMDMQMPGMDGLEATRRIRALPPPAGSVPIIALTANALAADAERCRVAGMNGYLSKPVEPRTLTAAMAEATGMSLSADVLAVGADAALLRQRLDALGHRVFPAASVAAAANLLRARPFDLVVATDCGSIAQLRAALPYLPPVLALGATANDGAGADAVVATDCQAHTLAAAIARLCGQPYAVARSLEQVLSPDHLHQVLTLLRQTLKETLAALEDEPDAETYDHLAHRIKGSAASLGLHHLQRAADSGDTPPAREALRQALRKALMDTEERMCTMASSEMHA